MRHSVTATNLHQGEPQNAKAKLQRLAARLPDGVATYRAANPDIALAACQESQRQTSTRAEAGRIVCYPPQTARPLPAPGKTPLDSSHYFLGLLFLVLSGLASGFACYLIVRYKHLHAHLTDDSISGPQNFHAVPTPRIGGLAILIGLLVAGSSLSTMILVTGGTGYIGSHICVALAQAGIFTLAPLAGEGRLMTGDDAAWAARFSPSPRWRGEGRGEGVCIDAPTDVCTMW